MMPDDEKVMENNKGPLAAKLALLLGLMPRSNWNDMSDGVLENLLFRSEDKDDKL